MGQAWCNSIWLREQRAGKSHPLPVSTFPGNGHLDLYAKSAVLSPPLCCPFILASPRAQGREGGKKEPMPLLHGHPTPCPPAGAARGLMDPPAPLPPAPSIPFLTSTDIVRLNKLGLPATRLGHYALVKLTCHFSSCWVAFCVCNWKKKKRSFSFWVHCFFNNGAHGKKIHLVKLTMERIQCLCPSVGTQVILIVADQRGSCSWESGGIRSGVREVCGLCDGTVYMCVCVHIWELTPVHASLDVCSHVLACVYRHVYIQTCGPQDVLEWRWWSNTGFRKARTHSHIRLFTNCQVYCILTLVPVSELALGNLKRSTFKFLPSSNTFREEQNFSTPTRSFWACSFSVGGQGCLEPSGVQQSLWLPPFTPSWDYQMPPGNARCQLWGAQLPPAEKHCCR